MTRCLGEEDGLYRNYIVDLLLALKGGEVKLERQLGGRR